MIKGMIRRVRGVCMGCCDRRMTMVVMRVGVCVVVMLDGMGQGRLVMMV